MIHLKKSKKLRLNHVMSQDMGSGIFADLMAYSKKYCEPTDTIIVSNKPVEGCDVYHYHRPHLESSLLGNSVVTVHHDINDNDKWLLFPKFEKQYRQAKLIICLNTVQQIALKKLGFNHTVVIPHGFNEHIFKASEKTEKEVINLGVISKRYGRKVKGEALLFEIMKRLDREKIKFTFIGKDRTQDCWRARDLGFEAVVFERLPYKVFGSVYEGLDALLITSLFEGGPANLPEAISSSTPVFGTNVGMVNDYIDNDCGIILSGNPALDSLAINKYARDLNYQRSIKKRAHEISTTALSWKEVTKKQFEVYRGIANEL